MTVLCLIEHDGPAVPGLSLQALTFARSVAEQGDGRLAALCVGAPDPEVHSRLAAHGATDLYVVTDDRLGEFNFRRCLFSVFKFRPSERDPALIV